MLVIAMSQPLMALNHAAATHQLNNENDERDDQQEMDQPSA
jgi:hypothetical protein